MKILLAVLIAAPVYAQSDLSAVFGGAEGRMRAAKELQLRIPARAPAVKAQAAPIAETVSRGACMTPDEMNPLDGVVDSPSCSAVIDKTPGSRGGSAGAAVVYLDASRRPTGAVLAREKRVFSIGKGALSGQEFWAVESLYWTFDAAGVMTKAERYVPALYASEADCADCRYFDRYQVKEADGSERVVLVGRKPAPASQSDLDEALGLWRSAVR